MSKAQKAGLRSERKVQCELGCCLCKSGDMRGDTVDSWKERLPELLQGYSKENIWNMDETGCFSKALPDKGFGMKGGSAREGKR